MDVDFKTVSTLFVAGALMLPAGAAATTDASVQLQVKAAAADTASAQRLAQVAPQRADALLKRSRSELAAAFARTKKEAAANQAKARSFEQRLRSDAKAMRGLAAKSSGRLAQHAKQAVAADRLMAAQLAPGSSPAADQQSTDSADGSGSTVDVSARVSLS